MPAINNSLVKRAIADASFLVKRGNFASTNPGIILVFCILGAIAILITSLIVHKKLRARAALKQ